MNREDNTAVVIFESPLRNIDVEGMERACQDNPLDQGRSLSFHGVPVSSTMAPAVCSIVRVTGLGPETANQAVQYFFSNKRTNAGGPVTRVVKDPGSSTALVHFENPADAESVVNKGSHVLDGRSLCVSLHAASHSGDRTGQQGPAFPIQGTAFPPQGATFHPEGSFPRSQANERQEAADNPERTAWRDTNNPSASDMSSSINSPGGSARDTQKPPSRGNMEDIIPNLKPAQIKILRMPKTMEKLKKGYPGLEISVDEDQKIATVRAPETSMKKAYTDVLAFVTNVREMKIPLSPAMALMFKKKDAEDWIQKTLVERYDLLCHWEASDDHIILSGQSSDLSRQEQMLQSVFKEASCSITEKDACLLKSPAWTSFLERMQEMDRGGCPTPVLLPEETQIIIVDTPSNLSQTLLALTQFLEEKRLESKTSPINVNPMNYTGFGSEFRSPPRTVRMELGADVIQNIISDKTLLTKIIQEIRSVQSRYQWERPDHIVITSRCQDPGQNWESHVDEMMNRFVRPIRLQLQRERECAGQEAADNPERTSWVNVNNTSRMNMSSSATTPVGSARDTQKPPFAKNMEDIIPNLKPAQIKILRLPKTMEKLKRDHPGLEISVDEDQKIATVRAPETSMKKAYTDVLAFVTNVREMKIPLSPAMALMYKKKDAEDWIQKTLVERYDLLCHWEASDDHIILSGQSSDLSRQEQMLKSVFKEASCPITEKDACLLKTPAWTSFLERMQEMDRGGCPTPVLLPEETQIIIVDTLSKLSQTRLALTKFLEEKRLESKTSPINVNPVNYTGFRSEFRPPPRTVMMELGADVIQKIISDNTLLTKMIQEIRSVQSIYQWERPDHIVITCRCQDPGQNWESHVDEMMNRLVQPIRLQLQRERKCAGQEAADNPERTSWVNVNNTSRMNMSSSATTPVGSARDTQKPPFAKNMEDIIPNLKPAQIKILRMPKTIEKLKKGYPGLEISVDEDQKIATVGAPETSMKKAYTDVLAFVTNVREMKIPLSPAMAQMYKKKDAEDWIQKTLVERYDLLCHWEASDDHIILSGQSSDLSRQEQMLQSVFKEASCPITEKDACLLKSPAWTSFLERMQEMDRGGCPTPVLLPEETQIIIVDTPSNLSQTLLALTQFLEEKRLESKTSPINVNPMNYTGFGSEFRSPPRTVRMELGADVIQNIISDKTLLTKIIQEIRSVQSRYQWERPDHIVITSRCQDPGQNWESHVDEMMNRFVRPIRLQLQRERECAGQEAADNPERTSWVNVNNTSRMNMSSSATTPVGSARDTQKPPFAKNMEDIIPNLKPAQIKILRLPKTMEKLKRDHPGLEISVDEDQKIATVRAPETSMKKAYTDVLAFVTNVREMKIPLSPAMALMYKKKDAEDWIQKTLVERYDLLCHWEASDDHIILSGQSSDLSRQEQMLKSVFKEASCPITEKDACLLKTPAWTSFLERMQEMDRGGCPTPVLLPEETQIIIVDTLSKLSQTRLALTKFLEEKRLESKTSPINVNPVNYTGFRSEFRPPPRTVMMELGADVIQKIISDNTLLTKMIQEIRSVQSIYQWERPDHIVITCRCQDPGQNWESHVDEMMNRLVQPIRLQLQRERKCAGQEAADNPERTSWVNVNNTSRRNMSSSATTPVGSARDTQKPPFAKNMEDIIPNLKPAQIKILRMPKTIEKLKKGYPGLEISVDEDQKIATVGAPETSMKKAYTDVLAFVTNVREMKIPLSPAMAQMYKKKDAEDWIQKTLVERYDLLCHWEASDDHIILSGQSSDLSRQEQMLQSVFTEFSCSITEKDACLLKSPAWTSFLERMQEMDRGGCPTPVLLPEETQIIIVDTPSNLSQTRLALTKFLEEKRLESKTSPINVNPMNYTGFRSEFRPPPRTVRMELGADVIQKIISDNTLLTKMLQEIRSVQSIYQWERPDHIVITCRCQDPGQNWESHVDEMMNHFVRPIRLQLQRERECAGQEAADNPERSSWVIVNNTSRMNMSSSATTPVGSAIDTQKPPFAKNMEDIIPNLKPAQIKILRLPKTMEKLKRDHPGLEISVDEDQKIATLRAPETSMKKAYTDVLAFVTNVREMKIPLSPAMAQMFKKKDAEDWIQKTLVERYDLLCHWEASDDHIILSGQSSDLSRQEQMLQSVFKEASCPITEKDACLLKSPAWTSFLERMQEMDRRGCPTPVLLPEETQIIIVDTPSNLSQTRLDLTKFLEENKLEKAKKKIKVLVVQEGITQSQTEAVISAANHHLGHLYDVELDLTKTDMARGQVPDFWEPQGANDTVKLVALKNADPEYQTVAKRFSARVGNVNILNIERVQNPHLYHLYIAKKAHMEKQNPGIENEKILWHGTSPDAITNINHHGFNRSYCGKNATAYGNGVYFAVNARYSASSTYSLPDMSGKRCVYQCKVLVGHPTTGHPNLRVLPARQGPILYDSATDNPNAPSMYLIFNDTQAYPYYMLTFQ